MKNLSLLFLLFFAFSTQAQVYELSQVDKAPTFAKGKMKSSDFLRYYLTYPKSDYDKGIEGTITLSYVVDSLGQVLNPKVLTGLTPGLNEEALRLASLFPYYTPAQKNGKYVSVKIQFPVKFQLDNSKVSADVEPVINTKTASNEPKNPLYVVDGKILEENSNIDPSSIKKIRVLKGKKAIELYGQRAKDGAILVETK